ncbi:MAG: transcription-repair coupling factor [Bacteroidetes bacterium 4484_276]|nr:MAG: transcription-repair coupling factor [Bacteroidetes bacterium 4484_276]OYT13284.1 MAG: transcription-repair coupling factor [Bacteroidetes bacterium 4572_114]
MTVSEILNIYQNNPKTGQISSLLDSKNVERLHLKGMVGSQRSFVAASVFQAIRGTHVFILPDKESAAYFHNDLESIFAERDMEYSKRHVLFLPTSCKRPYEIGKTDSSSVLLRSEVLNKISKSGRKLLIVTFPEAIAEKVVSKSIVAKNTFRINKGDRIDQDFMIEALEEFQFENVDFVVEPGQFAIRGGIIDVFSFSNDYPFRIEFFGDEIESIRTFEPGSQLSQKMISRVYIMPDLQKTEKVGQKVPFISFIPKTSTFWIDDLQFAIDRMDLEMDKAMQTYQSSNQPDIEINPDNLFITGSDFLHGLLSFSTVEFGHQMMTDPTFVFEFDAQPQPSFNKKFDFLINNLNENSKAGIHNFFFSGNPKQSERLNVILNDINFKEGQNNNLDYNTINLPIHKGFIDSGFKLACYTDHQIFDRYHRFHLRDSIKGREAITLKEIYNLQPGDYITHIDHGVGRFDGLETIENNGKKQEAIRLVYENGDLLYISIHSLHRISKFVGKEGVAPRLNRLGSNNWNRLKERTKKKVKDIAKDLIKLYAKRKSTKGFSYLPDTYLQHELEASFIYEDTPDQFKATVDVKADLEKDFPMDRLVCGDVGFGKTEVAIRAAFKAVTDGKQVAVLVPTTILALQHYNTFRDRLKDFPVDVEYINRFKTAKEQKKIIENLEKGRLDILIGTHRLVSKDIKFKDLGLLILDEEQRFGVAVKDKLKQLKVNVDTLTLTATPIPRTLQFSLMGARDLSVINTPPPNRMPIQTELKGFNTDVIADAINYEASRNGQVFFIHNRVKNIESVADMIRKLCPGVKIGIGHGQMEGHKLEKVMLGFIEGDFDVLVSTTIVENGLDIPNANTIIINDAQNFGLSEMHQLRGRVGRANKKAFCYLLSPPLSTLTTEARKRLKAIEEFSNLGSGFNIAMRDLDIRGAGNLLGAEQSGFISDIGYEMYNKILDEAMLELRETEFKGLFKDEGEIDFVKDCQIETDQEILIPKNYISITTERLSLYKELDNIETEQDLLAYKKRMEDRFGAVPPEVDALFQTLRLRWIGRKIGFEKVLLKNNKFYGYFIKNEESNYFQSEAFTHILNFLQHNKMSATLRENKKKLSLVFNDVTNVDAAIEKIKPLLC